MCHSICVEVWVQVASIGSLFPPCGRSEDPAVVIRLGSKHCYLLNHFNCPERWMRIVHLPYLIKAVTLTVCIFCFSTTAKVPQRLVGFMRPENGNTQQMQQELQRKFHGKLFLVVSYTSYPHLAPPKNCITWIRNNELPLFRVRFSENANLLLLKCHLCGFKIKQHGYCWFQ